jgi:23S rRNA (pseudouridine1915-N3)-methyltransferase
MLKIRIIVVGRTRSPFLKDGEVFYLARLRNYAQVEWVETKPARIIKGRPDTAILKEDAQGIEKRLFPGDHTVALDRSGRQCGSEKFAAWLDSLSRRGVGVVSFVIGGPLGLSRDMLEQVNEVLSLSEFTLTHEMSRLILLEQLYRAFTILRGEKYHK